MPTDLKKAITDNPKEITKDEETNQVKGPYNSFFQTLENTFFLSLKNFILNFEFGARPAEVKPVVKPPAVVVTPPSVAKPASTGGVGGVTPGGPGSTSSSSAQSKVTPLGTATPPTKLATPSTATPASARPRPPALSTASLDPLSGLPVTSSGVARKSTDPFPSQPPAPAPALTVKPALPTPPPTPKPIAVVTPIPPVNPVKTVNPMKTIDPEKAEKERIAAELDQFREMAMDIIEVFEAKEVKRYETANPKASNNIKIVDTDTIQLCTETQIAGNAFRDVYAEHAEKLMKKNKLVATTNYFSSINSLKNSVANWLYPYAGFDEVAYNAFKAYFQWAFQAHPVSKLRQQHNKVSEIFIDINKIRAEVEKVTENIDPNMKKQLDDIWKTTKKQYDEL